MDDRQVSIRGAKFPPVDIIIPFHGHYHEVIECVDSVISKTYFQNYTLTVVDDCSPNATFHQGLKDRYKGIRAQFLKTERHSGFAAALHLGYRATTNPWVCFLHADCLIEQTDWLARMLESMASLRAGGVRLVHARVSHGGGGSFPPEVVGNEKVADKVVQAPLPLICALAHRELFPRVGGFVREYFPGGYEDEDLFWRMKHKNFKQAVCGGCFVRHGGGEVMASLLTEDILSKNRADFVARIKALYAK